MRKRYFNRKRSGALILSVTMALSLPAGSLGASAQTLPEGGLCEHHTEHDAECGYQPEQREAACVHEHDASCYEADPTASPSDASRLNCKHQCDNDCGTVVTDPGKACGYVCQVCQEEGQEAQAGQEKLPAGEASTASPSDAQREDEDENLKRGRIVSWEWVGREDGKESGKLVLHVLEGKKLSLEDVLAQLPEQILAKIKPYETEDGEETASPAVARRARAAKLVLAEEEEEVTFDGLQWQSDSFPEEGAGNGQYVFRADLPEGYSLTGSAKALSMVVEIRVGGKASIGDVAYDTMADAFNAAQAGDVIVMQADAAEDLRLGTNPVSDVNAPAVQNLIDIPDDLTLDLNGHTFTGESSYPLGLYQVSGFTITDSAFLENGAADEEAGETELGSGAEDTAEAVQGQIQGDNGKTSAIYAKDTDGLVIEAGIIGGLKRGLELAGTECTITGGEIEGSSYGVYVGTGSQLSVEDGTFKGGNGGNDRAALFVAKNSESVTLRGGTYEGGAAAVRAIGTRTVADLLADGYGYLDEQDEVITDQNILFGNVIEEKVTVGESDIEIIPGEVVVDLSTDTVTYGYSRQPVFTASAAGAEGFKWYEETAAGNVLAGEGDTYTFPTGRNAGTYTFYCEAVVNGETKTSEKLTITVEKAETSINNRGYELAYEYTGDPVPDPADSFAATSNMPLTFTWYDEAGEEMDKAPEAAGTYTLAVRAEETDNYLGAEEEFTVIILEAGEEPGGSGGGSGSGGSGGSSGGSSGGGGGSSSGGASPSAGPAADPGVTSPDSQKGYVNTVKGILTGNPGEGYSHWVSDLIGWKLYYPNGTYAAGTISTTEAGQTIETVKWEKVNGTWWAFGADGYTESGWILDQGSWYWQDANAGMLTGWQVIAGKWYYFDTTGINRPTGAMYHGEYTPDGYWVAADGAWDGREKQR